MSAEQIARAIGSAGMSAEQIARAIGSAMRGTDGWWNAKCPAHPDGKASLGLKDTEDGEVAYKCMAGCDAKSVGDALKAKGLLPKRKDKNTRKPSGKIGATYDYLDEVGSLLFQVCRMEPKDFRQRRPDGNGGWDWRLGDTRRVLYRLPELLEHFRLIPVRSRRR
jgi:putative DNA primase/helicase